MLEKVEMLMQWLGLRHADAITLNEQNIIITVKNYWLL